MTLIFVMPMCFAVLVGPANIEVQRFPSGPRLELTPIELGTWAPGLIRGALPPGVAAEQLAGGRETRIHQVMLV